VKNGNLFCDLISGTRFITLSGTWLLPKATSIPYVACQCK